MEEKGYQTELCKFDETDKERIGNAIGFDYLDQKSGSINYTKKGNRKLSLIKKNKFLYLYTKELIDLYSTSNDYRLIFLYFYVNLAVKMLGILTLFSCLCNKYS